MISLLGRRVFASTVNVHGARWMSSRAAKVLVSLAGPDRVGIVKDFSNTLQSNKGNMEESRMAQLGGEFAMIALITMDTDKLSSFHGTLKKSFPGFSLAVRETKESKQPKRKEYMIEIDGPDSVGIVAHITETLAKKGASIKNMDTETVTAPFAGFELFKMNALVEVDPTHLEDLKSGVSAAGEKFGLDIASVREVGS
mmetsp:Transcript_5735/g.17084  ORF Transcript_5735/g.17084 Transcript_5735/m.17084 type:complete len:198 (-) Transcript_5735:92-685(-)|eukprot:CAMPEP_0198727376 /NCGR_PEP_ID=MMETSP1475-20131203/4127_1 /TAXON_ID= ORGANISM="Unidentified sp., Strain CCMP1999" /NCGR_SAMPLE_ID=MMETSP1475 /ASSEMBLY_ACC=CAM_ASM_001111 /LENGTH=197 /DNA_ID=CAMNT_0044489411 /DNA_START=225 /DNA_END=818 /DNA_ORIENTATION=+